MKQNRQGRYIICVVLILIIPLISKFPSVHVSAASDSINIAMSCYSFSPEVNSSQRLDVSGGQFKNGTNLQTWVNNGTISQMFYVAPVSAGWYKICNIISQKAVDVTGGDMRNGTNVQIYEWNGTDAQLWRFQDAGNGYYYIQNN